MKGITFGNYHTDDLGVVVFDVAIAGAPLKENRKEVPGRDGSIDTSEVTGVQRFDDLEWTVDLHFLDKDDTFLQKSTDIINKLHGRHMQVVLDDLPGYYYDSKVTIPSNLVNLFLGQMVVQCRSFPYRLKQETTKITETIVGTGTITLTNEGRMVATPIITVDQNMIITIGTKQIALAPGTYKYNGVALPQGETMVNVVVTGADSGTITFEWREGVF